MTAPFFIVGTGRSGTTMLRRILDRHSQVCLPGETQFIPKYYKPFTRLIQMGQTKRAIDLIHGTSQVRQWQVRLEAEDIAGLQAEAAYVRAIDLLMQRRAAQDGKTIWGDKSPDYISAIPMLNRLFPEARFIHIFRDGRDVALSVMPLKWGPNNVYASAHWYRKAIDDWFRDSPLLGERAYAVSYEQFIKTPVDQMQALCHFLGLEYQPHLLEGFEVHADRTGHWRNKFYMTDKERELFEYAAGDVLESLGYARSVVHPNPPVALRAFCWLDEGYKQISNRLIRR